MAFSFVLSLSSTTHSIRLYTWRKKASSTPFRWEKERSKTLRRKKSRTTVENEKNLFSPRLLSLSPQWGCRNSVKWKGKSPCLSLSILKRENKRSYSLSPLPFQNRTNEAWNEKRRDHEEHHPPSLLPFLSRIVLNSSLWTDYQFAVFFFTTRVCLTFGEKKEIDNSLYLTVFP